MASKLIRALLALTLLCAATSLFAATEAVVVEDFRFETQDGLAQLAGQIDFPDASHGPFPLVVMVPGTGLFDRDVDFGQSGTDRDLIFKEISKNLLKKGVAVLRYDYRGVYCSMKTAPKCENCDDQNDLIKNYIQNCVDNEIRSRVTPENIREDIESVYRYGLNHHEIDPNLILAFGHSEGSLNLSHLVRENRISPKGLVFMGGLAESPASVVQWQMTDRLEKELFSLDQDSNGKVTNEEIDQGHKDSFLRFLPVDKLKSEAGYWTKETLNSELVRNYQQAASDASRASDSAPFGRGGIVQASMKWWKMFFSDWRNVADNLKAYQGSVSYHNGALDYQTNLERQVGHLQELSRLDTLDLKIFRYEGKGHTLGNNEITGPISQASMDRMITDIMRIIGENL